MDTTPRLSSRQLLRCPSQYTPRTTPTNRFSKLLSSGRAIPRRLLLPSLTAPFPFLIVLVRAVVLKFRFYDHTPLLS